MSAEHPTDTLSYIVVISHQCPRVPEAAEGLGGIKTKHAPTAERAGCPAISSVCAIWAGTSSRVLPRRLQRGRSRVSRLPRAASRQSTWRG